MATDQTTNTLQQRKDVVALQIRGLKVKKDFFQAGHEKFLPLIGTQSINEGWSLTGEERQRISQILNGNVQPADLRLLELCERSVPLAKRLKPAA